MPTHRNINGTWRLCIPWRNIGGVWKRCTVWRNIGGTWKIVGGAPVVTLNPNPAIASGSAPTVNSPVVASTVTGNVGGVTYNWSYVSGNGLSMLRPTNGATQQFQYSSFGGGGEGVSSVYRLTVTDTTTGQSGFANINISLNT